MLPAVTRPPAVVAFSGGVDSSLVLAAATSAARAHGLDDPIPATLRFPSATWTREDEWQEPVIASLGLADWERVELDQDLDLLGGLATGILDRHALVLPGQFAQHGAHRPPGRGRHIPHRCRRRRRPWGVALAPPRRDCFASCPPMSAAPWGPARARGARWPSAPCRPPCGAGCCRRGDAARCAIPTHNDYRWLRTEGRLMVGAGLADWDDQPVRWDEFVSWVDRRRTTMSYRRTLEVIGDDSGAAVCNPLIDRGFLGALAAGGGRLGYPDRAAAVTAIAGGPPTRAHRGTRHQGRLPRGLLGT